MRYIAKFILGSLFLAAVLSSCVEDKGNYDYKWVQTLELRLPELAPTDQVSVSFGANLQITPVFFDKSTGREVNVDYDDYTFSWDALPNNKLLKSERVHLGDKYNLNANIFLPVNSEYQNVTLTATNKKTTQIYLTRFQLRVTGMFASAYLFLTEDESRNVEMDIYGYSPQGVGELSYNFLAATGITQTAGGANGIIFNKPGNKIYIATGEALTWLDSPDFYHEEGYKIGNILIPATHNTFTAMKRLGGTGSGIMDRHILCFTPDKGVVNITNADMAFPNYAYIDGAPAAVAPMVGGYAAQSFSVYWSETHKKLCWASLMSQGFLMPSKSLTLIEDGIGKALSDCVYLGGCEELSREGIAIVKDISGDYWRINFVADVGMPEGFFPVITDLRKLDGTAGLGTINHWINSHEKGYIYAFTGNGMYTYIEAQVGGVSDPGWTKVAVTDSDNAPVTFADPVSFVHFEDDGKDCMYVFTYSEANGGTLYMLRPRTEGKDVELVDKITGLGNVKKMCYWWG